MRSLFTLFAIHALACLPAIAQTKQVLKTISTNGITESLVVPSGKTLTIASGATLTAASGSTITGIGSGLTIGSSTITSGTSGRALYNNSGVLGELDLASLYAPIASPTFTGTVTIPSGASISGYLTSATAASTYAPIASPTFTGTITIGTGGIVSPNPLFPTRNITISQGTFYWQNVGGSGFGVQLAPLTPTADRIVNFNPNGAIVSTADTGTVTNAMLAGSIALSKLATTGTASSSTYLRGDGAWTAIDLSSYLTTASAASTYLPLAGGTMTGALVLPAGSVSASSLTFGDADTGLYSSSATASVDVAIAGARMLQINTTGLRLANDTQDTIWRRSDVAMLIFHGQTSSSSGIGSVSYLPGVNLGSAASLRWTQDTPASTADVTLSRVTTSVLGIKASSATTGAAVELNEMTAPGTPSSDRARFYLEDNGSGKSRLVVKWADGTTSTIVTQP